MLFLANLGEGSSVSAGPSVGCGPSRALESRNEVLLGKRFLSSGNPTLMDPQTTLRAKKPCQVSQRVVFPSFPQWKNLGLPKAPSSESKQKDYMGSNSPFPKIGIQRPRMPRGPAASLHACPNGSQEGEGVTGVGGLGIRGEVEDLAGGGDQQEVSKRGCPGRGSTKAKYG